jgi:hypothetical protein
MILFRQCNERSIDRKTKFFSIRFTLTQMDSAYVVYHTSYDAPSAYPDGQQFHLSAERAALNGLTGV